MTSVFISGSNGFIGKNLKLHLNENTNFNLLEFNSTDNYDRLEELLLKANIIVHLAGINRSEHKENFIQGNIQLTKSIVEILERHNLKIPIIFTSSIHVIAKDASNEHLDYSKSKKQAEDILIKYSRKSVSGLRILRLPSVFGKWAKPFYNSFLATLCFSIVNSKPYKIDDSSKILRLLYIDDLVAHIISLLDDFCTDHCNDFQEITFSDEYRITLGDLEKKIKSFYKMRKALHVGDFGNGLDRRIYSTLISYLVPEDFSYNSYPIFDDRGYFVEFIKTQNAGQFSCIKVPIGQVRGQHYHHTKTEKFLVAQGEAKINFRCLNTGEEYSKIIDSPNSIIDTIPGWAHSLENIGGEDLIVLIWSNEVFQEDKPDTIYFNLEQKNHNEKT